MCKSYKIESFVEPLLRSLEINNSKNSDSDKTFGKRRADVIVPSVNDELTVVDVITVDVCKKSAFKDAKNEVSPLNSSEQYKRNKYDEPLTALKHISHVEYKLCPFAISIYGRLGRDALCFLSDFEKVVKKRMNKKFDFKFWLNRIVFTIFKTIPILISKALLALSVFYEEKADVSFNGNDCCFNDIEF
ncbi:hypothetical protein GEMRC1_013956 [Eukaryota sp. GEM-RC1]